MRGALLLVVVLCGCATTVQGRRPGPRTQAAVAIRDHVPGYQKAFTAAFTLPRLRDGYRGWWYFTASEERSQRDEFLRALEDATAEYDAVDVFLLAHSNRYVDLVAQLPEAKRRRIRLVYDTGCGDERQAKEWLALGVRAFVGHPDENVAPVFYVPFLSAWLRGLPASDAVAVANRALREGLTSPLGRFVLAAGSLLSQEPLDPDALWRHTEATLFAATPKDRSVALGVR